MMKRWYVTSIRINLQQKTRTQSDKIELQQISLVYMTIVITNPADI